MSELLQDDDPTISLSSPSLQDGLLNQVVNLTKLIGTGRTDYSDVVGEASTCLFHDLPPIPDRFTSTKLMEEKEKLSEGEFLKRVHENYQKRFEPHLAYELRGEIDYHFFHLVTACQEPELEDITDAAPVTRYVMPKATTAAATTAADAWVRHTPLCKHLTRLCIQAHTHSPTFLKDDTFSVIALPDAPSPTSLKRQRYSGICPTDKEVEMAAKNGITAVLSTNSIVVVMIPLRRFAEAYAAETRTAGPASQAASAEKLVRKVLEGLPETWRMLGCVPRLARVCGINFRTKKAFLSFYEFHTPREYTGPSLTGLVYGTTSTQADVLYIKKLTSLGSAIMQLKAVREFGNSRFLKFLYDPSLTKKSCLLWLKKISALPDSCVFGAKVLNKHQLSAVKGVLHATYPDRHLQVSYAKSKKPFPNAPKIVMIEGPPGTGKTQTIVMSILNVLRHGEELCAGRSNQLGTFAHRPKPRVLYVAPSNAAVDEGLLRLHKVLAAVGEHNKLKKLSKRWKVLRVGLKSKVDDKVLNLWPEVYIDDMCERMIGKNIRNKPIAAARIVVSRDAVKRNLIRTASVVFTTLGSLHGLHSYLPDDKQYRKSFFDAVIVDEASQCTEPAVLQALQVVQKGGSLILVGDSKQLQPTVLSKESSHLGLCRSLLVRLLACGHRSFLLRTQYRMHPDICAFPNAYFYAGELETHLSVMERQEKPISDGKGAIGSLIPTNWSRLLMYDVQGGNMVSGLSRSASNLEEAKAVLRFMRSLRFRFLLSEKEMAPQLGIITFYKAQRDLILSMLTPREAESGLQVATVDSFQGKEKRIILLSCVRTGSGSHSSAGFLAVWNRLNVALTRAQDLCVCFCSRRWVVDLKNRRNAADQQREAHRLTTLDSTKDEVVQQLEAHYTNTQVLYKLWEHLNMLKEEKLEAKQQQQAEELQRKREEQKARSKKQRRKENARRHVTTYITRSREREEKKFFIGAGD